eukprot:UN34046
MRKVQSEYPEKAKAIMKTVRDVFEESEFQFQRDWATIITGTQEGLYGWVTANYLNGFLKGHEIDVGSKGVLEMGGESVQLTFIPDQENMQFVPKDKISPLTIGVETYNIFTHSWMGYGMEAAQAKIDKLHSDEANSPCYLVGQSHEANGHEWAGTGDYDACVSELEDITKNETECEDIPSLECSLDGITIPKIEVERFYYIENFYYTLDTVGVSADGPNYVSEMTSKRKELCSLTEEEARIKLPSADDFSLSKLRFSTAWITTILNSGFKLKDYTT